MRVIAIAAVVLLAGLGSAQAADLVVVPEAELAPVDTGFVNSVYFQLLGGAALQADAELYVANGDVLNNILPLDTGYAIAGTVGVGIWEGLSVEADVLYSSRNLSDEDDYPFSTLSLMANLKYTLPLGDMLSIYGAAGVGVIDIGEGPGSDAFHYDGAGYQLIAGVSADFTDNISGVLEYRYQNTFDVAPREDDDYYGYIVPVSAVMAGLKFSL